MHYFAFTSKQNRALIENDWIIKNVCGCHLKRFKIKPVHMKTFVSNKDEAPQQYFAYQMTAQVRALGLL